MYELMPESQDNLIGIRVSGKLTTGDYHQFEELLAERVGQHGWVSLLVLMQDFSGWETLSAAWEDLKIDVKYNRKVRRIAMVGDEWWEEKVTQLSKPFVHGQMRYFDQARLEDAWAWIRQSE
jgi:hypothetical protein